MMAASNANATAKEQKNCRQLLHIQNRHYRERNAIEHRKHLDGDVVRVRVL
jgi:hypothetical protein